MSDEYTKLTVENVIPICDEMQGQDCIHTYKYKDFLFRTELGYGCFKSITVFVPKKLVNDLFPKGLDLHKDRKNFSNQLLQK